MNQNAVIDFGTDGIVEYVKFEPLTPTVVAIVDPTPTETYWQAYRREERYFTAEAAIAAGLNPKSDRHDVYTVFVGTDANGEFRRMDVRGKLRIALAAAKVKPGVSYTITRNDKKGSDTAYTVEVYDDVRGADGMTFAERMWAAFNAE